MTNILQLGEKNTKIASCRPVFADDPTIRSEIIMERIQSPYIEFLPVRQDITVQLGELARRDYSYDQTGKET